MTRSPLMQVKTRPGERLQPTAAFNLGMIVYLRAGSCKLALSAFNLAAVRACPFLQHEHMLVVPLANVDAAAAP